MKGYGVNVHKTKSQSIQGNTKQWNNAFIVVLHLEVTMRPSTITLTDALTTDTASSVSFLDLYLEFDDSGQLSTKIYDKRDDFNFKIINFPNMCSKIPINTGKYKAMEQCFYCCSSP
jgi:hypothetical protein